MRWCARCRDPQLRRELGLREPLALPPWLVEALAAEAPGAVRGGGRASGDGEADRAPRLHRFDPDRQSAPTCPPFSGVRVYREALTPAEADRLLREIEAEPFIPSQSGKHKQHYGPRFNFMRRRMNAERFDGLPASAHFLEERLRACVRADHSGDARDLEACRAALVDFETTDLFVLRYFERERSNLDFHVDDLHAYGEVILDVSLDSDSILTFLGPLQPAVAADETHCVRVPLPARSIAVVHGAARFAWQHAVLPDDVRGIRTSLTLRTLAPALRSSDAGRRVLERARRRA